MPSPPNNLDESGLYYNLSQKFCTKKRSEATSMNRALFRQLDRVNLLTLGSVPLILCTVVFSIEGQFEAAMLCILYTGCLDLFDGHLARRTERSAAQSALGARLDSLVDGCSHGLAPVVFGYSYGLRDWFSLLVLTVYLFAALARLAYFDSAGFHKIGETEYYVGLPLTFAALFFPNIFLLSFVVPEQTIQVILTLVYLGMAVAMVAGFHVAKYSPTRRGTPRRYIVLPIGALVLTLVYGYAIFG